MTLFIISVSGKVNHHELNEREKHFFYLKSNVFSSITQQSLVLQICLFYAFSFKMYMPKKIFMMKGYTIM